MLNRRHVIASLLAAVTLTACGANGLGPSLPSVQYRVSGSTNAASVTYANADEGTSQADVAVPWAFGPFRCGTEGQFLYISAQNDRDSGTILVEILKDGAVSKQSQSSGAFVIATASDSC